MNDFEQWSKDLGKSFKDVARWGVQMAGAAVGATAEVLRDLEKELRTAGDKLGGGEACCGHEQPPDAGEPPGSGPQR